MKFAVTKSFPCDYIKEQSEQLLVLMPPAQGVSHVHYRWLMSEGFRRSGEQIYRPHCANCSACKSVRIDVNHFEMSKSQKRLVNKNRHWQFSATNEITEEHYALYERYINERHASGAMHPPSKEQLLQFIECSWNPPMIFEARIEGRLIAAAVTDLFDDAVSALYTFFDPEVSSMSPGKMLILHQIRYAQEKCKRFVFLGYQVDECSKMAYKNQFLPQEQFIDGKWVSITKNTDE